MQKRKRLPTISPIQTQNDFNPPTRRRNLSLSSKHETEHTTLPQREGLSPPQPNFKQQTIKKCYQKKNKLVLFSDRMRKARDLTKLCLENVSQYLELKKSVHSFNSTGDAKRKASERTQSDNFQTSPKLSIKLLNVPINFTLKNTFYPTECNSRKLRMKTEASPKKQALIQSSFEISSFKLPYKNPTPIPVHSPKKYNELTLRQIIESEQQVSDRLQIFEKIKYLKERLRENIGQNVSENEEQPLMGW